MSKTIKNNIVTKIKKDKIKIKPKWVFAVGSALSVFGLFVSGLVILLAVQLIKFRLTHPGYGASRKLEYLLSNLPMYIPLLAIASLVIGYLILKRYDFSYRQNRKYIFVIILVTLFTSSYVMSKLGVDEFLSKKRIFRQMYYEQRQNLGPGINPRWGRFNPIDTR